MRASYAGGSPPFVVAFRRMQSEDAAPFSVCELSKSYGAHNVLDKISWQAPPAAVVGVLGANGSGKSTLFRLLLGLELPDSGRASVDGHEAANLPEPMRAAIGYVPQSTLLFPWFDGRAMLRYFGAFYPHFDHD